MDDLATRAQVIAYAARFGIDLAPDDIDMPEPGYPHIDDIPAGEWIDAMTMD